MPVSKIHSASMPDSIAIDTDVLVVDGANNRVGVGVTAPETKLDLIGNSDTTAALKIGPSASFGHHFYDSSTNGDLVIKREISGTQTETMRLNRSFGAVTKSSQPSFGGYLSPVGSGNRTYVSGTYYRKTNYSTATHETAFNVGNNFNTTTGIFTAPVQGTYVFHMRYSQGLANGRKIYQFQMPNGNFVEIAEDYLQHGDEHAAVLVKMNANDTVSTGLHSGIQDNVTVFFSGYLLG